jgi:hypothetical protein
MATSENIVHILTKMRRIIEDEKAFLQNVKNEKEELFKEIELLKNSQVEKWLFENILCEFFVDFVRINHSCHIDNRLSKLSAFENKLDRKIKAECKHEYIEDDVDIDPDRSERITYCKKCMCTF